jgi:TolA-binding protein
MFILQSCQGFVPGFHMWCCTKRQCNIQYTDQAIEDLGYPMEDNLELLTCHELQPSATAPTDSSSSSSNRSDLVVPLVASSLAVATLLAVAVLVLWRHRRAQRANRMKADEMQMQIGKYMQQLEKHREKSRNEQAELQKVKMQYKMLEMDLLANTASGKTAASAKAASEDKTATEATVRSIDPPVPGFSHLSHKFLL